MVECSFTMMTIQLLAGRWLASGDHMCFVKLRLRELIFVYDKYESVTRWPWIGKWSW